MNRDSPELTAVLPTYDEGPNVGGLIEGIRSVLAELGVTHEVLVVDAGSSDDTREVAQTAGARVIVQTAPGYGGAIREAFEEAAGQFVLTMDADSSHDPVFIRDMYAMRGQADMVIASRYVPGGRADMNRWRWLLSVILNKTFCLLLALPVRDISSGYRLYRRAILKEIDIRSRNFDVLEEILIKLYVRGHRIVEVPFHYKPRAHGRSHAKLIQFGFSYAKTLVRMMGLRFRNVSVNP